MIIVNLILTISFSISSMQSSWQSYYCWKWQQEYWVSFLKTG